MKKRKGINIWLWIPTVLVCFSSLVQILIVWLIIEEPVGPQAFIGLFTSFFLIVSIWLVRKKIIYVVSGIALFCTGLFFRNSFFDFEAIYLPILFAGISLFVITWFENKKDKEEEEKRYHVSVKEDSENPG